MFERYTEPARRALFFSRYACVELGGKAIEPAHLLLGLLRLRHPPVVHLLRSREIDEAALRTQLESQGSGGERIPTSTEIPFSEPTKQVLRFAAEEADRLNDRSIEPEHLLLGLLREERSDAASTLAAHGLRADTAREAMIRWRQDRVWISAEPPAASVLADQIARIEQAIDRLERAVTASPEVQMRIGDLRRELQHLRRLLG